MDLALRIILAVEIAAFFAVRVYFEPKRSADVTTKEAPRYVAVMSLVALIQVVALILAALAPQLIAFSIIAIGTPLRIAGAVLAAAGLLLLGWSTRTLGDNYHSVLHVRDGHELVTAGPYARVRHPIYTALYATFVGLSLLSASWLVALSGLGGLTVVVAIRLPGEERLMLERFGPVYAAYMARTNRFVP